MEEEWSCYRGGQFNGVRMVVTKELFNGEGIVMLESAHFNGGSGVMLQRWPV